MTSDYKALILNILLFFCALAVCLIFLEFGSRIYFGIPLNTNKDWRTLHAQLPNEGFSTSDYHTLVGWVNKADVKSKWLNTLQYGIRKKIHPKSNQFNQL
jgi:hypothetical protein